MTSKYNRRSRTRRPTSISRSVSRLHYLDWGNHDKPLLLLVHGQRDHAHNWDWVARELRDEYHIVAPDLRGHGDSAWAIGGNYAITDFVLDIAQLLAAIDKWPVTIVSHSMGAGISLALYRPVSRAGAPHRGGRRPRAVTGATGAAARDADQRTSSHLDREDAGSCRAARPSATSRSMRRQTACRR